MNFTNLHLLYRIFLSIGSDRLCTQSIRLSQTLSSKQCFVFIVSPCREVLLVRGDHFTIPDVDGRMRGRRAVGTTNFSIAPFGRRGSRDAVHDLHVSIAEDNPLIWNDGPAALAAADGVRLEIVQNAFAAQRVVDRLEARDVHVVGQDTMAIGAETVFQVAEMSTTETNPWTMATQQEELSGVWIGVNNTPILRLDFLEHSRECFLCSQQRFEHGSLLVTFDH